MFFQDKEVEKIFALMEELDRLPFEEPNMGKDGNWVPESPTGKSVFAQLIAPETRQALRKWYARLEAARLNPVALNLKASLERAINEELSEHPLR